MRRCSVGVFVMSLRRVVVTGMGVISPCGGNVQRSWETVAAGKSAAGPIARFDASRGAVRFACEVKDYNPNDHFSKKEANKLDLYTQYALLSVGEAIRDAFGAGGLGGIEKERAGVIWSSGVGGLQELERGVLSIHKEGMISPFFIPRMLLSIASGHISVRHDLRGINYSTCSACASSLHAIIEGYYHIRHGRADVVLAGGSEAAITKVGVEGFSAMRALSTRNDDCLTASRPYDKDRDGFVMGEGGACLILEDYEHALKRKAVVYGEIIGAGASSDAHHMVSPHPEGRGVISAMQNALDEAAIPREKVDYINTHGTSTPLGDASEVIAIKKVFSDHAYRLNISSTKSVSGHMLGAAGAFESVMCLFALREQAVPPTINHFTEDDALDPNINYTFHKAQKRKVEVAMNNSFGFGGHNTSVLFKRIEE